MKWENFNTIPHIAENNLRKPRILIAPLDWGLGHATRCIPIIHAFLQKGCEVWLAAEKAQESLLRQEFDNLPILPLRGYRVKYGRSPAGLLWNLLRQSGRLLKVIKEEHAWLLRAADQYGFDAIISDNRYGLWHPVIPSVFITHQLTIKTPFGNWADGILQKKNYAYINRFSQCWVPDNAGSDNLAGELAHPLKKPAIPLYYTGPLSRLKKSGEEEKKEHLLILLSGPEPQRTLFENKIVQDIAHYPATATIARGLPGAVNLIPSSNSIRFYNHLTADELEKEMNSANYIIARSGYSSIMDILALQKKSILVPTPGQSEQEYLARYLQEKKMAPFVPQKTFSLSHALQQARSFDYLPAGSMKPDTIDPVIEGLLNALKK